MHWWNSRGQSVICFIQDEAVAVAVVVEGQDKAVVDEGGEGDDLGDGNKGAKGGRGRRGFRFPDILQKIVRGLQR